jgi:hypothetical protein
MRDFCFIQQESLPLPFLEADETLGNAFVVYAPVSEVLFLLSGTDTSNWEGRSQWVVTIETFFHNIFVKDCLLP